MYPMGVWCLVWLLGVPRNKRVEFLSPCLLVIMMVAGGGVVLCENCIVDAKSFFCLISCVVLCVFFVWRTAIECSNPRVWGWCGWCVCCKGARWMPGHVKPMKDVKGCVKPRGVAD